MNKPSFHLDLQQMGIPECPPQMVSSFVLPLLREDQTIIADDPLIVSGGTLMISVISNAKKPTIDHKTKQMTFQFESFYIGQAHWCTGGSYLDPYDIDDMMRENSL